MKEEVLQPPTTTAGSKTTSTSGAQATTTTTTVVRKEEETTSSSKQQHQLTITKFYERVPREPADKGQLISCPDLVPEADTFEEKVVMGNNKDRISRDDLMSPGKSSSYHEAPDTSAREENIRGDDSDNVRRESTAPPVDRDCSYKKGTCLIHRKKGLRYLQESKTWLDRGGGRGFGWVTRRIVRYRCSLKSMDIETIPGENLTMSSSL